MEDTRLKIRDTLENLDQCFSTGSPWKIDGPWLDLYSPVHFIYRESGSESAF